MVVAIWKQLTSAIVKNMHQKWSLLFWHTYIQNCLSLLSCKCTRSVAIAKRTTRNKVQEFHILRNRHSLPRATKILFIRIQTAHCRNHLVYLWHNDRHRCLSAAAVIIDVVAADVFATVHVMGSWAPNHNLCCNQKPINKRQKNYYARKTACQLLFFISSFQFT